MKDKLIWNFPLLEPGAGVLMGNGTMGLMVWGDECLKLTVSRNGFWDRRGGKPLQTGATFEKLKELLQAGKSEEARHLFVRASSPEGYGKPTQLPGARLEISSPGWKPSVAKLSLAEGALEILWEGEDKAAARCVIHMARDQEVAWLETGEAPPDLKLRMVPMWEFLGKELKQDGVCAPVIEERADGGSITQSLPEDPSLTVAWQRADCRIVVTTQLGGKHPEPVELERMELRTREWWTKYWADVPCLHLPDPELQHAFLYGVFLQAGLTPPEGVAATLVGPWMEEFLFPAWRNDYHFNINVQMIYGSCLPSNRPDHLRPLWDMIRQWLPQMRETARRFFQCEGALMLPHATDDVGHPVDDFWTGMVDHGCTAWMAILAWQHYRYTLDEVLLRETAWPLLSGTFNGYWAMLEEREGDYRLSLPITVSPEYGGAGRNAWGRDASFQLAALHRVAAILDKAAGVLGEKIDPRWEKVRRELPPYSLQESADLWTGETVRRVALWEGQDLEVSHRHHSHLALLYPFGSIDPLAPEHRQILRDTLRHWLARGAGIWAGWSHPWAASLCAAADLPDAAITWLHWWRDVYNNPGHGSDHNGDFAGCGVSNRGYFFPEDPNERYRPVIQLDGAMGAVTAILEILVQCRAGIITVFPCIPMRWQTCSFDGILTEGAILAGASVDGGILQEIRITSMKGGNLRLRNPWQKQVSDSGAVITRQMQAGERIVFTKENVHQTSIKS